MIKSVVWSRVSLPRYGVEWSNVLYPAAAGRVAKEAVPYTMPFTYILKNIDTGRHYIGSCVDLNIRLRRHELHTGGRTTKEGVWEILCYKECVSISEARILEKKVKSYKGGNAFKKIINGAVSEWSNVPLC